MVEPNDVTEDAIEDDPEKPGKIIRLNKDDDNQNDAPDLDDLHRWDYTNKNATDDDFAEMKLAFSGASLGDLEGYELWLGSQSGVKLYSSTDKQWLIQDPGDPSDTGKRSYSLPTNEGMWYKWTLDAKVKLPKTVYAEGVSTGTHHAYWRLVKSSTQGILGRDTVQVTVLQVDLTVWNGGSDLDNGEETGAQGLVVADVDEESVGAYLLVNWDDDDGDGQMDADGTFSQLPVPDLTENNSVQNEDNLAQLMPFLDPSLDMGTVELDVTSGANRIKLWTQSTKGTEIALTNSKKTWDLSNASQKSAFENVCSNGLWIEGIAKSAAERDVTLVLRYRHNGQEIMSDTVKATVVMINLGNAVYRDGAGAAAGRGHAALVTSFDGPCTRTNLLDDAKFSITEVQSTHVVQVVSLTTITQAAGLDPWGCFTNTTAITYADRLRILKWADTLVGDMDYEWNDALLPANWNNALNTISSLRCDGLVEVCYEANGIDAWGKTVAGATHYDILNNTYQAEHNNFDLLGSWADTLMPATQCGHVTPVDAATAFTEQDLCTPVGSKGGN